MLVGKGDVCVLSQGIATKEDGGFTWQKPRFKTLVRDVKLMLHKQTSNVITGNFMRTSTMNRENLI